MDTTCSCTAIGGTGILILNIFSLDMLYGIADLLDIEYKYSCFFTKKWYRYLFNIFLFGHTEKHTSFAQNFSFCQFTYPAVPYCAIVMVLSSLFHLFKYPMYPPPPDTTGYFPFSINSFFVTLSPRIISHTSSSVSIVAPWYFIPAFSSASFSNAKYSLGIKHSVCLSVCLSVCKDCLAI